MFRHVLAGLVLAAGGTGLAGAQSNFVTPHPILFVTVFPIQNDFATIGSVFANHGPSRADAGRGGDLWIRYQNGALRNITREEGFGVAGVNQDSPDAIAVRDVSVHWNATRAVFAMVRGNQGLWQLYEVAGPGLLSPAGDLTITKLPNQPIDYNNLDPTYASDGAVIFTSDRPRNGARHLYPQLDEYESQGTVTGLWKLSTSGDLTLMNHLPSGAFGPLVDQFGRVVFTRWDHMERDQQEGPDTFNWADESTNTTTFPSTGTDVFPEHKSQPLPGQNEHFFNFFLPWQINQDGTEEEVLNHLGRHELASYFVPRLTTDPRIVEFFRITRPQETAIDEDGGVLHLAEDPRGAGCFVATEADEFGTHSGGRLLKWCAPPSTNPEDVVVSIVADDAGNYRDPMFLDVPAQTVIAAHTSANNLVTARGDIADPTYRFRLKVLEPAGKGLLRAAGQPLTDSATMTRNVQFGGSFTYNEPMWELSPVEVRVRTPPPATGFELHSPEAAAFAQAGVDPQAFRDYLRQQGLGVIVVRDATTRDRGEKQQPYNLRVPGGRETLERNAQGQVVPGTVYDIAAMQMVQGDQVRGWLDPDRGRRVIGQFMHDPSAMALNTHALPALQGAVPINGDGSVALYVPTRRALSWQTVGPAPQHVPVVLERYWLTLQPGEIRACDGCHGVNQLNQARQPASQQVASAFVELLTRWKADNPSDRLFRNGFENP